jgi:hypothetical protein
MKRNLLVTFLLLTAFNTYCQNPSDTIEVKKVLGTVFRQSGKNLTPRNLLDITKSNSEAYKEIQIAKSIYDVGNVLVFVGGFMVGWPIGTAIAGGEPN